MSNAERLIAIYNHLDRFMRDLDEKDQYIPFSRRVQKLATHGGPFDKYKTDLLLLSDLRNILVHEAYLDNINPIMEPNPKLMERFEMIYGRIISPPKALDVVALKGHEIYKVGFDARATRVMENMIRHGYAHVPVVENEVVQGVFSEHSVVNYLTQMPGSSIGPELRVGEIMSVVQKDSYQHQRYRFAHRDVTAFEVEDMFWSQQGQDRKGRLVAVFLTSTGKKGGMLLGMVTAANIAGFRV